MFLTSLPSRPGFVHLPNPGSAAPEPMFDHKVEDIMSVGTIPELIRMIGDYLADDEDYLALSTMSQACNMYKQHLEVLFEPARRPYELVSNKEWKMLSTAKKTALRKTSFGTFELSSQSGFNIQCIDKAQDHLLGNLEYLECNSLSTIDTPFPGPSLLYPPYLFSLKHLVLPSAEKVYDSYSGFFLDLKLFCPALETLTLCQETTPYTDAHLTTLERERRSWAKVGWMRRAIREADLRSLTHIFASGGPSCSLAVKINYRVEHKCRTQEYKMQMTGRTDLNDLSLQAFFASVAKYHLFPPNTIIQLVQVIASSGSGVYKPVTTHYLSQLRGCLSSIVDMTRELMAHNPSSDLVPIEVTFSDWDNRWNLDQEANTSHHGGAGVIGGNGNALGLAPVHLHPGPLPPSPQAPRRSRRRDASSTRHIPPCLDGYTEQLNLVYEANTNVHASTEPVWVQEVHQGVIDEMMVAAPVAPGAHVPLPPPFANGPLNGLFGGAANELPGWMQAANHPDVFGWWNPPNHDILDFTTHTFPGALNSATGNVAGLLDDEEATILAGLVNMPAEAHGWPGAVGFPGPLDPAAGYALGLPTIANQVVPWWFGTAAGDGVEWPDVVAEDLFGPFDMWGDVEEESGEEESEGEDSEGEVGVA